MNRRFRDERGVYMVLMAILIPVLFALGAIVIDVGNWYVHRRHLQTQVDAAALAGGQSLFGCYQDTTGTNGKVEQAALDYAGDPTRRPLTTVNLQVQASQKVHAVINSPNYWSSGTPTDGTGYDYLDVSTDADSPKLGLPGRPCYNGWVDMKATDDQPTPLWGLIPLRPSPKTVARVELDTAVTVAGVLPLGLPDINPEWVAAIVVNEDAPNWQTNAFAVRKAGMLFSQTTPPSGLEGMNAYQGVLSGVSLNGANNFGVFILTSLNTTAPSLTGSLDTICGQTPVPAGQVECFAYDGSGQEVSFIHSYSTSDAPTAATPKLREAPIFGGCPEDLSAPYFNVNGGCAMSMVAKVDFLCASGICTNPTDPPKLGGVCADVTSNVGTVTYNAGTSSWTIVFTPPDASTSTGRYPVTLSWRTYKLKGNGDCNNNIDTQGPLGTAGAPYVTDVDANSGGIQYLRVSYGGFPGTPANSIDQPASVALTVTLGLQPPLQDTPLDADPQAFRIGKFNTPSQTLALDCGASGAAGWRAKIVSGCSSYSVNERSGICTTPYPNPSAPDCIASETGAFSVLNAYEQRFIPDGCAVDQNNWDRSGNTVPPVGDPRWAQLFVVDRKGFTISGKKYYPIRRFINVYVTAGDGLGCTGDDSAGQPVARNELWGHVTTYVTPDPDASPSQVKCSMLEGDVCVPVLVK